MNNEIHDEYATKPRTIKPIFIRTKENLGQLQIDVRRMRRPSWRKNRYEQIDQSLCAISKGSSSIRIRAETRKILEEKYNEHTTMK
jgi:translation elongation factor EF-1alpha